MFDCTRLTGVLDVAFVRGRIAASTLVMTPLLLQIFSHLNEKAKSQCERIDLTKSTGSYLSTHVAMPMPPLVALSMTTSSLI